jgi:hypothetical protein
MIQYSSSDVPGLIRLNPGSAASRPELPPRRVRSRLELIAGALRGRDDDAWRRFVHLYGPVVCPWCRRLGVVGDDAADVVQKVWAAVATSLEGQRRRLFPDHDAALATAGDLASLSLPTLPPR